MKFWVKNILAIFIGLGLIGGSFYFLKDGLTKYLVWEQVLGNEVGHNYGYLEKRGGIIVGFTYEGKQYKFPTHLTGKDHLTDYVNVIVVFPKGEPENAEVWTFSERIILPGIPGLIGLFTATVGFFSMKNRKKTGLNAQPKTA
jgi:hypothetical protein